MQGKGKRQNRPVTGFVSMRLPTRLLARRLRRGRVLAAILGCRPDRSHLGSANSAAAIAIRIRQSIKKKAMGTGIFSYLASRVVGNQT
jgi:hypothetical protein